MVIELDSTLTTERDLLIYLDDAVRNEDDVIEINQNEAVILAEALEEYIKMKVNK